MSSEREWGSTGSKVQGWEEPGIAGNYRSPGGPATGEHAKELWEEGRKVCEGPVVKHLACQEFGFYALGTSPRRILELLDKQYFFQ